MKKLLVSVFAVLLSLIFFTVSQNETQAQAPLRCTIESLDQATVDNTVSISVSHGATPSPGQIISISVTAFDISSNQTVGPVTGESDPGQASATVEMSFPTVTTYAILAEATNTRDGTKSFCTKSIKINEAPSTEPEPEELPEPGEGLTRCDPDNPVCGEGETCQELYTGGEWVCMSNDYGPTACPICPPGFEMNPDYEWDGVSTNTICVNKLDNSVTSAPEETEPCGDDGFCRLGCGCVKGEAVELCAGDPFSEACYPNNCSPFPPPDPCPGGVCDTAIGPINVNSPGEFIGRLFSVILSIAGLIAVILLIYSGYKILASRGDKEAIAGARETITSAITGLLFIILSIAILEFIGVDILRIPGFTR